MLKHNRATALRRDIRQVRSSQALRGCGQAKGPAACATGPLKPCRVRQMRLISRSLVSGRKISATTKLIAAMMIGYHRPE